MITRFKKLLLVALMLLLPLTLTSCSILDDFLNSIDKPTTTDKEDDDDDDESDYESQTEEQTQTDEESSEQLNIFYDVKLEDKMFEYDGFKHSLHVEGDLPAGTEIDYVNNHQTEVGKYEVTAVITKDGYETLTLKATLTIYVEAKYEPMEIRKYKNYLIKDWERLVEAVGFVDSFAENKRAGINKAIADGIKAINEANNIADAKKAYEDNRMALISSLPKADGIKSYIDLSRAEKTKILGQLESYAVRNGITGISLFENGGRVMYNERVQLGTENYIPGYGFGEGYEGQLAGVVLYGYTKGQEDYAEETIQFVQTPQPDGSIKVTLTVPAATWNMCKDKANHGLDIYYYEVINGNKVVQATSVPATL